MSTSYNPQSVSAKAMANLSRSDREVVVLCQQQYMLLPVDLVARAQKAEKEVTVKETA